MGELRREEGEINRFFSLLSFLLDIQNSTSNLTQRNETRGVGGTNTRATVLDGGVGDGELTEVVSNHISLNLYGDISLSIVNTSDGTDHLGDDDDVTEVGLDGFGALTEVGVDANLGLAKLAHKVGLRLLKSTGELSADTSGEQIVQLVRGHGDQILKVHSTVGVLAENSLARSLTSLCVLSHSVY